MDELGILYQIWPILVYLPHPILVSCIDGSTSCIFVSRHAGAIDFVNRIRSESRTSAILFSTVVNL